MDDEWAEKAVRIGATLITEAARKKISQIETERDLALRLLEDARNGVCHMDAPNGPECWCGKPSAYQSGECEHHGNEAIRSHRMKEALEAAEERGRLIGEWVGILGHTEDMAVVLDGVAYAEDPREAAKREAVTLRILVRTGRAKPFRPAEFTDEDELRELRRCEAEAAVRVLRFSESHTLEIHVIEKDRLYRRWIDAAARVNARVLAIEEKVHEAKHRDD